MLGTDHSDENTEKHGFIAPVKWMDTLIKTNPDGYDAHMALGRACLQASLWGEARSHFDHARKIKLPSREWFAAMAELEKADHKNATAAQTWLETMQTAPDDDTWVCAQTGRTYKQWMPITPPHNGFDTLIWDNPANHANKEGIEPDSPALLSQL